MVTRTATSVPAGASGSTLPAMALPSTVTTFTPCWTAAWTFFNISQYILGIQPTLDGLKVDPCIPHTLSGFTVTRRYRGAVYHITVDNTAGVQHGIKAVTVDGKTISGNVLPLATAGTEVTVQVTMG